MRARVTAIAILLAATTGLQAQAAPPLKTVLARLASYLNDYAERLPATIADEHYEQRTGRIASGDQVVLESEFGIMRLGGSGGWLGLRDVVSVNGRAVAGHEQRLQALFTHPSAQDLQQARRVAQQNARFNIGPIQRTINDPAVVLELLDGRNASRMRFTKTDEATVDGARVWAIRYEERRRPTIIRSPEGRDQPARGTAWVEPATGRLVRAELTIESESSRIGPLVQIGFTATLEVVFKDEPRLGFWVPSEMTERYEGRDTSLSSGEATYSNYRAFGVQTRILIPDP